LAAISIGQREFEQWNLDVSVLRCVPSGSKSRHFKRQASQEFWTLSSGQLHIHLDQLSAPRYTQAMMSLCEQVNALDLTLPETTFRLRFHVKLRPESRQK
jgi:hypothetical protein